jgi:asparagine synthase (glutamine-hydrolysing)
MCGIAGLFFAADRDASEHSVKSVLSAISYRGPDHQGTFVHQCGVMGNVRLAIQGVDPRGNQPHFNEDRTIAVVFNGEIYNYPELRQLIISQGHTVQSDTDTEVLVHLYEQYGIAFASKLNGMFAFAIFDSRSETVLLGRDPAGQKPLFVRHNIDGLCFASELRPFIGTFGTTGVDLAAIPEFLSLGYILEPRTICSDVRTLMPGTLERHFADGRCESFRYWRADVAEMSINSMESWLDEAEPIFRRAVRRHVLSDVPVTLFLSGGVDSSLILSLAAEETSIKEAYCGSFTDAADHDEFRYAETLATACALRCCRVDLSDRVLAACLPEFLSRLSQPIGDYSALAMYPLAREVARTYRVVLGGDGGDELFGGYPTYRLPILQRRFRMLPRVVIQAGHRLTSLFSRRSTYMGLAFQLQQVAQAWGLSDSDAHFEIKNFLPRAFRQHLSTILQSQPTTTAMEFRRIFELQRSDDIPVRLANLDLETFMLSGTIPKVERMTMLHSIEARLPFLDKEILALSQRTPSELRMRNGLLKAPLRALQQRIWRRSGRGPMPTMNPRKQGFSPPLRRLLDGPFREWRDDTLTAGKQFFSTNPHEAIIGLQRRGIDTHRLEWSLCILIDWTSRFGLSLTHLG